MFIERSLDQNLTPQREVGVQLWGDIAGGIVRYEVGLFNGTPDYGLQDIDNNKWKTWGGRIFIQPFNTPGLRYLGRLGVGIAGSTGVREWLDGADERGGVEHLAAGLQERRPEHDLQLHLQHHRPDGRRSWPTAATAA